MTPPDQIDVTRLINDRPISRYQFGVFFLCAFAALMDGYDSVIIGITAPAIGRSLGLDVKVFGPVFSAAQLGFMISAFIAGPLADRFGRKTVLVASVGAFGVASLLTPLSTSFSHLVVFRLLTGIGLGGASVTFVSLSTEYAPLRVRATIVSVMWTMMPLGSVIGGVISSAVLPAFGWQSIYYIGGVAPVLTALLMLVLVPESISFLASRRQGGRRLPEIIRRIAPDLQATTETRFVVEDEGGGAAGIGALFRAGRARMTALLWLAFFCCWLVLVTIVAWVVPIIEEAGIGSAQAPLMVSLFAGGTLIGAPIVGRIMDKHDLYGVLVGFLVFAAASMSCLGFFMQSVQLFGIGTLIGGIALGGASSGLVALVAASYPVSIRSTGVGCAIGMARFGGTVGPVVAGGLLETGASLHSFFLLMGTVSLAGAGAVLVLKRHMTLAGAMPGTHHPRLGNT